jgi:hypothetical protein
MLLHIFLVNEPFDAVWLGSLTLTDMTKTRNY